MWISMLFACVTLRIALYCSNRNSQCIALFFSPSLPHLWPGLCEQIAQWFALLIALLFWKTAHLCDKIPLKVARTSVADGNVWPVLLRWLPARGHGKVADGLSWTQGQILRSGYMCVLRNQVSLYACVCSLRSCLWSLLCEIQQGMQEKLVQKMLLLIIQYLYIVNSFNKSLHCSTNNQV